MVDTETGETIRAKQLNLIINIDKNEKINNLTKMSLISDQVKL
jgi:hypothetical protein